MQLNEIKLYLGIIVSNGASVLLIMAIALIHAEIYSLDHPTLGVTLLSIIFFTGLISAYFWRNLSMRLSDYLKYYTLNILVALFWITLLIL